MSSRRILVWAADFGDGMFQDVEVDRISFAERAANENDYAVSVRGRDVLTKADGILPTFAELGKDPGESKCTYLLSLDEKSFYYIMDDAKQENGDIAFRYMRVILEGCGQLLRFACATAVHMAQWYDNNRFCGRCAAKMEKSPSEDHALLCPECGHLIFPDIAPVVIVGVINGDSILMTRYNRSAGYQKHALIAGFVEIGETLEHAVMREVQEEAGVSVRNLKYYGSQPWAFSRSLLAGFFCEAEDDRIQVNADGKDELSEAVWVKRDDIELEDSDLALTWTMIREFKAGRW